ncbi:MAG: hypothetical protein AAF409_21250 [Pseudomonadota bacterium]
MTDRNKTTDASKVELTDEQLDDVQAGLAAAYLKLGDIDGESKAIPTETFSLNFGKIEFQDSTRNTDALRGAASKTLKF